MDKRSAHLPQGRFQLILVQKESHLLEPVRCVVLSPVWAKMVDSAKDWKWSSYRATARPADVLGFLTTEWSLSQFDRDMPGTQRAYRRFVRQGRGVEIWTDLQYGDLLCTGAFDKALRNDRIHQTMRAHECTLKEVAAHLGQHYSTISLIAKRVDQVLGHQEQRPPTKN